MGKMKTPVTDENIRKICDEIADLLQRHSEGIGKVIDETSDRKLTISMSIDIDAIDAAPTIDIKFRYTPCKVSDCRSITCEDPNQLTIKLDINPETDFKPRIVSGDETTTENPEDAQTGSESPVRNPLFETENMPTEAETMAAIGVKKTKKNKNKKIALEKI